MMYEVRNMAVYYLNEFFIKNVIVDRGNRIILVEVIFPKVTVKHFLFHQVILRQNIKGDAKNLLQQF